MEMAIAKLQKIRHKQGHQHLRIDHGFPSPTLQLISQQLEGILQRFLAKAGEKAAHAAKKKAEEYVKITDDQMLQILYAANEVITWDDLFNDTAQQLYLASVVGGKEGIAQLDVVATYVPDMTSKVEDAAQIYARKRAAEMIGKKFIDGILIDNSSAEWVISETTRDDIKDIIEQSFDENLTPEDLAIAIQEATTFSPERAELIAKTEISIAQVQGNLGVWKRTGFVKTVNIVLSMDHDVYDECDEAAEGGPYALEDVPFVPRHPRCRCALVAAEISE